MKKKLDNSKKVIVREYNIFTANLYNFYVCNKISSVTYNNFIALTLNFNYASIFEGYYAGLIIFGYANSTDYNLDLENYIINENNLNVKIDLKSFLEIQNNVFGYEYSGSKIINIDNCNNIKFYSSKNINREININSKLEKDETIRFYFEAKEYIFRRKE